MEILGRRLLIGTILGIRKSAILEIGIFLTFVSVLGILAGNEARFFTSFPHPCWIIIGLIIVQYGVKEALLAAFACSLYLLAFNLPEASIHENSYEYLYRVSLRPIMWFLAATILGQLRGRELGKLDSLSTEIKTIEGRESLLVDSYEQLKAIKEDLELKLAEQLRSAATIYRAVRRIEVLSQSQILKNIEGVVKEVMNPQKFSVFELGPHGLEAVLSEGWKTQEGYMRRFTPEHQLYQEVVLQKRALSVVSETDVHILGGEGILAAPLVDKSTGAVFGMIKIESLPFDEITLSNIETFEVLSEWIGHAFGQAQKHKKSEQNGLVNSETSLFTYGFYQWQFQLFEKLSRFTPIKLFSIRAKITNIGKNKEESLEQLCSLIKEVLPQTLGIYDGKSIFRELIILLPTDASGKGSDHLLAISSALEDNPISDKLKLSLHAEVLDFAAAAVPEEHVELLV